MLARMVDNVARPEPADAVRRAVEHIISDIVDHERDGEPIPLIADVEEAELPHPEGERDHQPARENASDRAAQPERQRSQRVARFVAARSDAPPGGQEGGRSCKTWLSADS